MRVQFVWSCVSLRCVLSPPAASWPRNVPHVPGRSFPLSAARLSPNSFVLFVAPACPARCSWRFAERSSRSSPFILFLPPSPNCAARLPPNSFVVFVGLVDGRVLYDTMSQVGIVLPILQLGSGSSAVADCLVFLCSVDRCAPCVLRWLTALRPAPSPRLRMSLEFGGAAARWCRHLSDQSSLAASADTRVGPCVFRCL